jgi:hypothetical protein
MARLPVSDRLDQTHDGDAAPGRRNHVEGLRKAQRVWIGEECTPERIGTRVPVGAATVEQGGERHGESAGDLIQPAGAHAVRAAFVLLYLLGRHSEMVPELGLAQPALQATDSNIPTDQNIHAPGRFDMRSLPAIARA